VATYYIAPTGDDTTGNGSIGLPWKTPNKANSVMVAGDVCYCRGGTYSNAKLTNYSGGAAGNYKKYINYPGETPVFDGANWTYPGAYDALFYVGGSYMWIEGITVQRSSNYGIHSEGANNVIKNCNEIESWQQGIICRGDNTLIEGCTSQNGGKGGTIINAAWPWGIGIAKPGTIAAGTVSGGTIRGCTVWNCFGEGICTYNSIGVTIEDCVAYDNYSTQFYINSAENVTFRRNIGYTTPNSPIIWSGAGMAPQSSGLAISAEANDRPNGANGSKIYNNFFYKNSVGITCHSNVGINTFRNGLIANNTSMDGLGGRLGGPCAINVTSGIDMTGTVIENNIFVQSDANPVVTGASNGAIWLDNLWSKAPSAFAVGAGDQTADPLIARTGTTGPGELTANYFKLLTGSPAIDTATVLADVTEDFFKSARGSSPDKGGHEYGATAGGSDLALNKAVVASSIGSIEGSPAADAANAVDGNAATRWTSERSDPQWIYVDLGARYVINRVKLVWEAAYGSSYQIQVSDDATNWTTIYATTIGDGGTDDLTGLSGTGRYVRMYGTVRGTIYGYSLWSFEVYGTGALPVGWTALDVGAVGLPGASSYVSPTFSLDGSGANVWDVADSFHMAYRQITGDCTLTCRVASLENTATYAKFGLMMRASTATDSVHCTVDVLPGDVIENLRRSATGGTTVNDQTIGTTDRWLRMVRSGNTITRYRSADGVTWTAIGGTQTLAFGSTIYCALFVCAQNNTTLATGTFDSVSFLATTNAVGTAAGSSTVTGVIKQQRRVVGAAAGIATVNGSGSVQQPIVSASDGINPRIYLAEITAYDPGTSAIITYRFASGLGYDNAGTFHAPRIENPALFRRDMGGEVIGGRMSNSPGELTLINNDGGLNAMADDYFDGRTLTLKVGDPDMAYASFATILVATIETVAIERRRVSVRLRSRAIALDTPFSSVKYAGTNALPLGIEGTADDIKGQSKPRIFGRIALMPPVLVNTSKLIYQINAGAVDAIVNVFDAGAYLARSTDYTSQSDMETNQPSPGSFRSWPAGGCFRLGSTPFGQLSVCVAEKWDYTQISAGAIIQRILMEKGFTSLDWLAADFTILNTKTVGALGISINAEESTASVLDRICATIGAWWGFDALGRFRIARLDAPSGTPAVTITDNEILELERQPVTTPVPWQVTQTADINLLPQDKKSMAGVVPDFRAAWFAEASRDQKASNSGVATSRALAVDQSSEGLFASISQAQAEVNRRLSVFSARRDAVTLTLADPAGDYAYLDLGGTINLVTNRLGYGSGRLMVITGLQADYRLNRLDLALWG
jgi:hypothetical protein